MNKLDREKEQCNLEVSEIIVADILERTCIDTILYLEEQGTSLEEYVDKLYKICNRLFKDSTKTVRGAEKYIYDFCTRWDNYLCENEFAYFMVSVMRGNNPVDEGPTMRMAAWNIELAFLFETHPVCSLNISRGQGKSWFCICYFTYLAYRYKKKVGSKFTKYSMAENLMIFGGDGLIKEHIRTITGWIESNYMLFKRLAEGKGYEPSATMLRLKNGSQIVAKPFLSAARGFRGSIFIDDYCLEEYNQNLLVQDKIFARITQALFPIASNPFSQIIMAATPVSPDDLIQRIWRDSGPKIHKFEYRAIESDGTVLDPNLQNLERILERRQTYTKKAFLQEVMLIADIEIDRIFTWNILNKTKDESYSWVDMFSDFEYKDRTEAVMGGNDYSFSSSDTSDYNAFSSTAWTKDIFGEGMFRVFGLYHEQVLSLPKIIREAHRVYHQWNVDILNSENNSMQSAINTQLIDMGLNVQRMNTTQKFKLDSMRGVPALATLMDIGKLKFPYKTEKDRSITDTVLKQFYGMQIKEEPNKPLKFESGVGHDDIVMSISLGVLGSKEIDNINMLSGDGDEAILWNNAIERQKRAEAARKGKSYLDQEIDDIGMNIFDTEKL